MVSSTSVEAYELIGDFEVMVRRLIRWELRGNFGKDWIIQLGAFSAAIEFNIQRETSVNGIYDGHSSELSYLTLGELFIILSNKTFNFARYWSPSKISRKDQSDVVSIRNRVAHFRQVLDSELSKAKSLDWIIDSLKAYFLAAQFDIAQLQDPDEMMTQSSANSAITKFAEKLGLQSVILNYSEYEETGRKGFKTKLGIFEHHFYLDVFCEYGFFDGLNIIAWMQKVKDKVTLLKVGSNCQYLRIFVSVKFSDKEITKIFKSAVSVASSDHKPNEQLCDVACQRLINSESDYLLVESAPTNIAFSI